MNMCVYIYIIIIISIIVIIIVIIIIEWASARVPPTPLLGGWAEGGWSISNPVTSQIFERETWFLSTQLAPT